MRFALTTCLALIALPQLAFAAPDFQKDVEPYLKKRCLECHGPTKQEGEFRIDKLSSNVARDDGPHWGEVVERISSGEMPPPELKDRPTGAENATVVEWLSARLKEGESARLAKRGRVSFNRLTREEYVNTVYDLIGVQVDATDPGGLLEDPEWHGIERVGAILTLSPSNIEKYLAAAEKVLAEAYPATNPKPIDFARRAVPADHINEHHRERLAALGQLDKVRYEMWPGDLYRSGSPPGTMPAGVYELSYTLSGLKPEKGRTPRLLVYESKLDRVLFEQDILAPEDKPITVSFLAHLPEGHPTIHLINDVPGPSNIPRSGRHGNKPFVSIQDGRMPWQLKLTDEQGRARYPFLILDSYTFKGPMISKEQLARREEYFPREPGNMDQVRDGLRKLAQRAFRRPATNQELDAYVGIVAAELAAGEKFPDAVKAGMLAILSSKSFLFVSEGNEDAQRNSLNDWEIACRLSYLLWSTMPDDELFALAEQGKLRDRDELSRQFQRMLADPRSARFSESFARQWLNLQKVGMFPPDKKLYPDYDKNLEKSMVGESTAFFNEVLRSGLTLREFLDSNWTMINGRLARFYGLPEPVEPGFVRVSLPAESHRGGLLAQAGILSLTSDGTRHRPVHRGKWVSEVILGKSPPPPPANVDPIEPNPVDSPKATLRMRLEAHVHDARCASCHSKIDPLGLAFENYDAIGRWRTHELVEGTGDNPEIKPGGKLPDGRTYQTPEEFKQLLVADIDAFNTAFVDKLATYGLRRTMTYDDREDLAAVAKASRAKDYRLRDLLEAFVLSDLFQKR